MGAGLGKARPPRSEFRGQGAMSGDGARSVRDEARIVRDVLTPGGEYTGPGDMSNSFKEQKGTGEGGRGMHYLGTQ